MRVLPTAIFVSFISSMAIADQQEYDFSGFSSIDTYGGLEVTIVGGDSFSIRANGEEKVLGNLEITQEGDVLSVRIEEDSRFSIARLFGQENTPAHVAIMLPSLASIDASAGSLVTVSGAFAAVFELNASSGAVVDVNEFPEGQITISASSGAVVNANGVCTALSADASSGANVEAEDLGCDTAIVAASSGGILSVQAESVQANASSGGVVQVQGAANLDAHESSGGIVTQD